MLTESSLTTWKTSAREAAWQELVSLLYQRKETGASASEGPQTGRRERFQATWGLEQFLSSPSLFAVVSHGCPGVGYGPED